MIVLVFIYVLNSSSRRLQNGGKRFLFSAVSITSFSSVNRQSVFVNNGEAVRHGFPVRHGHGPFSNIPQRQIEKRQHCLIVGERGPWSLSQRHDSATPRRLLYEARGKSPVDVQRTESPGTNSCARTWRLSETSHPIGPRVQVTDRLPSAGGSARL